MKVLRRRRRRREREREKKREKEKKGAKHNCGERRRREKKPLGWLNLIGKFGERARPEGVQSNEPESKDSEVYSSANPVPWIPPATLVRLSCAV